MKRVFLSHGGAEWNAVKPVADRLVESGFRVIGWEHPEQEQWFVGSALQQVEAAHVTVVLITPAATKSSVVAEEINHSIRKDKGIVGIRVDRETMAPEELFLAGAEVLDWSDPEDVSDLPRALGAAERGARLLARAVRRGSGSGAPCARPIP